MLFSLTVIHKAPLGPLTLSTCVPCRYHSAPMALHTIADDPQIRTPAQTLPWTSTTVGSATAYSASLFVVFPISVDKTHTSMGLGKTCEDIPGHPFHLPGLAILPSHPP